MRIPKGIADKQHIRIKGKGSLQTADGLPGDLLVAVSVAPDAFFARRGYDVFAPLRLTLSQAVLGAALAVRTLDAVEQLLVRPGTQHGQIYCLPGKGLQKLAPLEGAGDLFFQVAVVVPQRLNEVEARLF